MALVTGSSRGLGRATALELDTSITLLDQETIDSASVQHFEELIALVPNMNWSGDGARARYFQLRGIGELEQYEGAPNPSIGFIIDDIDLSGIANDRVQGRHAARLGDRPHMNMMNLVDARDVVHVDDALVHADTTQDGRSLAAD